MKIFSKRNFHTFITTIVVIAAAASCGLVRNGNNSANDVVLGDVPAVLDDTSDELIIYVAEGIYSDIKLTISKQSRKATVIRPRTPGTVQIKGKSTIRVLKSSNVRLEGMWFDGVSADAVVIDESQNISISNNYFDGCGSSPTSSIIRVMGGSSNNKIYNNTFYDNRAIGINIHNRPSDTGNIKNEIYNNYFYKIPSVKSIYPESNGNGLEAIQIGQSHNREIIQQALKTKIFRNLFEEIIGDGVEIISNKSSENYIFQNTFLNNRSGVTLRAGDRVHVDANYFNNTTGGLRVYGSEHVITNNYIQGAEIGIDLPAADFLQDEEFSISGYHQQSNCEISNNVIVSPRVNAISLGRGERRLLPTNITIASNRTIITDSAGQEYDVNPRVERRTLRFADNDVVFDKELAAEGEQVRRRSRVGESQIENHRQREKIVRTAGSRNQVEKTIGMTPFVTHDKRVGAHWATPGNR